MEARVRQSSTTSILWSKARIFIQVEGRGQMSWGKELQKDLHFKSFKLSKVRISVGASKKPWGHPVPDSWHADKLSLANLLSNKWKQRKKRNSAEPQVILLDQLLPNASEKNFLKSFVFFKSLKTDGKYAIHTTLWSHLSDCVVKLKAHLEHRTIDNRFLETAKKCD